MKPCHIFPVLLLFYNTGLRSQKDHPPKDHQPSFTKHVITNEFISEGVAVGDVNKDGKPDILAGAYWFEAPEWTKHAIAVGAHYDPTTGFSNSFLNYCMDVNLDGWPDLIRISLPGEEAVWYENPGKRPGLWPMHVILKTLGNESPAFVDVDGDGRADILCNDPTAKEMIWLKAPVLAGDTVWQRFVIAGAKGAPPIDPPGVGRYTHGLGWEDMNGDGRKDAVITKGWWQAPADPRQPNWSWHAADLGEDCSQIYALYPSGTHSAKDGVHSAKTGVHDLVTASAHDYGIWWHEKIMDSVGANGKEAWSHHLIFSGFSESHALAMADIDGDGYPDLVTGKRYFAHNEKDPGALEPSVLYWFEFKPAAPGIKGSIPSWIPHQVDDNSGVGLQVLPVDMNGDGLLDIVVSNKKGLFFFEQK